MLIHRFLIALAVLPASLFPVASKAAELEITLEAGSVFTTDVPLSSINWTEVQSDGQVEVRRVPVADIKRLWLCETPASNKVAEIRELLSALNSDNYHQRESAELELSAPNVGGLYPRMLRQFASVADTETKYRIDRILNKISDRESSAPTEYDELELRSGRILRGDAGQFEFSCTVDGQRLDLQRNQLRMLRIPKSLADNSEEPRSIETEIVLQSEGIFYLPEQTTIQLEKDPIGNELDRKADISETYVPLGLMLDCLEPGYVGISGYGFKFPNTPTGNNSGSVFQEFRSGSQVRYKKFRGTLIIDFCLPNQPFVPAGVHSFGVHVANIDHERDIIMEAFNSAGQVIATVEAGERDCPFLGVRSNELIAQLRIRSNPFLKNTRRRVDDDFAFDSICLSQPERIQTSLGDQDNATGSKARVQLRNGNVWVGNRIELQSDGSVFLYDGAFDSPVKLPFDQIASYTLVNEKTERPDRRSWSVQLVDGSILNVNPDKQFRSQLAPSYQVTINDLVALWPSESPARYPQTDDLKNYSAAVVLPTGSLLTNDIKFDSDGFRWQTIDQRVQKLAPNATASAQKENPLQEISHIIYREVDRDFAPTLWLQQPRTLDPQAGYVLLWDGQRLMFGEGHLFQLLETGPDSIRVKLADRTLDVKTDRIHSIKFTK